MMTSAGFITIELLVAMALVVTIVGSTSQIIFSMQDAQVQSQLTWEALDTLEYQALALATGAIRMYELPAAPVVPSPFELTRTVIAASPCTGVVHAQVSWIGARERIVNMPIGITDGRALAELGNDCPVRGLSNAWSSTIPGGVTLCHARLAAHTADVVNRSAKRIVVVGGTSTQAADPDICIYEVDASSSPAFLASLHTGQGIFSLDIAGNYVYAVQNSSSLQFQIVDVTTPSHPFLIASRSLPGTTGSFPQGRSITVFRNRAYIGTYETAGSEFHIFDITNPYSPQSLASRAVNHSIRQILIRPTMIAGNERLLAYLASSGNSAEVLILDVTTPSSITEVAHVDLPGTGSATAEAFLADKLLVGRQQQFGERALAIVDITNPTQPQLLSQPDLGLRSGSVVNGLVASNQTLILTTTDTLATTYVCRLTQDTQVTTCTYSKSLSDPGRPDFEDDIVFAPDGHGLNVLKPGP